MVLISLCKRAGSLYGGQYSSLASAPSPIGASRSGPRSRFRSSSSSIPPGAWFSSPTISRRLRGSVWEMDISNIGSLLAFFKDDDVCLLGMLQGTATMVAFAAPNQARGGYQSLGYIELPWCGIEPFVSSTSGRLLCRSLSCAPMTRESLCVYSLGSSSAKNIMRSSIAPPAGFSLERNRILALVLQVSQTIKSVTLQVLPAPKIPWMFRALRPVSKLRYTLLRTATKWPESSLAVSIMCCARRMSGGAGIWSVKQKKAWKIKVALLGGRPWSLRIVGGAAQHALIVWRLPTLERPCVLVRVIVAASARAPPGRVSPQIQ